MKRSFDDADERRGLAGGLVTVDVVRLGEREASRVSHAPGWRWTAHSAPEAGVPRCPATHVGILVSGRMRVEPEEGEAYDVEAGDVFAIPPGHDAWTLGDEPAVLVQFA